MKQLKTQKGFTLIELIVVIGIIAVLATIVIVAVNPARQLASGRQTKRKSDVAQILNAIHQYAADTGATPSMNGTATDICDSVTKGSACSGGLTDLGPIVPTYISSIPTDPGGTNSSGPVTPGDAANTKYQASKNATTGRVTVSAPIGNQETVGAQVISVTR